MSDAFAERAAQWDANPVRAAVARAFHAQVEQAVAAHIPGGLMGKDVLDFGCGTGVLGLRLAQEHGARLTFVDASPAMLGVLRNKLSQEDAPKALVLEGDLASLPLKEASQDMAATLMAMHHVRDVGAALARLRALLKPGGLFVMGDLLPEDGGFHSGSNHDESAFHNGFDPEELRARCTALGMDVLRLTPFHVVRKPDQGGTEREYPLFLLVARAL